MQHTIDELQSGERWDDCDSLASSDPIACLLCRTSKMNDGMHALARQMAVGFAGMETAIETLHGRDERLELQMKHARSVVSLMGIVGLLSTVGFKVIEDWPRLSQLGSDLLLLVRGA